MAHDDQQTAVRLPEELRRQFVSLENRLWKLETAYAVCTSFAGLALSWLGLFVSDRVWDAPSWMRTSLLMLGSAIAFGSALFWTRNWIFRRRDMRAFATLVQSKYRVLGDRLLGIVELANEQHHLANFSPALYRAAIDQVAEEAKRYDFSQSIDTRSTKKVFCATVLLLGCVLFCATLFPQASWNAFVRWIAPMASIQRYTLVTLNGLPRTLVIPHGEAVSIAGSVSYNSFWRPGRVTGHLERQPEIKSVAENGRFLLTLPGQLEPGRLLVRVGDAQQSIEFTPQYRPSLKELSARILLPDYLRYPEQTELVQNGALLALEGSKVGFRATISRPLTNARMQAQGTKPVPIQTQGAEFTTPESPVEGLTQFVFDWEDTLGLSNSAPLRLNVQAQKDAPPSPELPDVPRETAMLAQDVLQIRLQARDDFGIRDFGLAWDFSTEKPVEGDRSAVTEAKMATTTPREKKVEKTFQWSPSIFRIPADSVVELQGYARDYLPQRERSRTPIYRIHVLSPENHAEMLRQKLESVLARSEEVTRLQEKIVANTQDIKENEKLGESQKNARIGQTKDDQNQNARNLQELAKEGEQTLREAMKNPVFTEEMIQQWSKTMQAWQKLSQQKMKEAAQSMQSAQQNPRSRQQDMADALQKAEEALKELQKLQNKGNQDIDDLQALTLSQRLKKAGEQETEISSFLQKNVPELIGLLPGELPARIRELETGLVKQQAAVQQESEALQKEISRFFERTQKTNYNEVCQEMKSKRTVEELEQLGGLIADNIAIESASQLTNWAAQFQQWSEKLEQKNDSSSGSGSGSGAGNDKLDMTKQLIALLRLRQKEMTLREQTVLLDQNKGDPSEYRKQAGALASNQNGLLEELSEIQQKTPLPNLKEPFAETGKAMSEVQQLLGKPQTDDATATAQTKSIELLTDVINLINEQAQRPNPQSMAGASPEEMEFLLKMMQGDGEQKGMAMKPAAGMHTSGGSTDRTATSATGNARGKSAGSRTVNKAAGVAESCPTEFREALENYFHAVEKNTK